MLIETVRMIVRDFKQDDVYDLYEILGDFETMKNCEPAYHFDKTQMKAVKARDEYRMGCS